MNTSVNLVIATHNRHKVEEIRDILSGASRDMNNAIAFFSLDSFPEIGEIEEDGATLEENVRIKAKTVFDMIRTSRSDFGDMISLADDTGLEVDAIGGRPGVYSARYSGPNATYNENNAKLLRELRGVPSERRTAKFRCAIAIISNGVDNIAMGEVPGRILESPRGTNGFGYDPLFVPDGFEQTYAEMNSDLKNSLSHRSKAIRAAETILRSLLQRG